MEQSGTEYSILTKEGQKLIYKIHDHIPAEPGWSIIGNIELNGWNLIGDPLYNVLAYKTGKNGHHMWAIGWEHPIEEKRAESPGFGFGEGDFFESVNYIPVAYVIGQLARLEEIKYPPNDRFNPSRYKGIQRYSYAIDHRIFDHKPKWRFRGQKTWIPMEPFSVIELVQKDLSTRFVRNQMFQPNFNINAIAWFHQETSTLLFKDDICDDYKSAFTRAALLLAEGSPFRTQPLTEMQRHLIPRDCILLLLLDSDPDNLLAINYLAKPRHISWARYIEILRSTRVAIATEESTREPVFPIRVLNIKTNTVDKL